MRDLKYIVIVDSRCFEFISARTALDFAQMATRQMIKKSWEAELPEVILKVVPVEEEPEEPEEELRCDEELEKECEA